MKNSKVIYVIEQGGINKEKCEDLTFFTEKLFV